MNCYECRKECEEIIEELGEDGFQEAVCDQCGQDVLEEISQEDY